MRWQARYYDGQLPLQTVTSDDMRVADLMDSGVIDITITSPDGYTMILLGADIYYMSDDASCFGLINEDGTTQHFMWTEPEGFMQVPIALVEKPRLLYGALMPDDEAREVGLL